jgi:hypothetical protein
MGRNGANHHSSPRSTKASIRVGVDVVGDALADQQPDDVGGEGDGPVPGVGKVQCGHHWVEIDPGDQACVRA